MAYTFTLPIAYTVFHTAQYLYAENNIDQGCYFRTQTQNFNDRFTWQAYKVFVGGAAIIGLTMDAISVLVSAG